MSSDTAPDRAAIIKALAYSGLNIFSATAIVFANKAVFAIYGFKFVCALTLIHTTVTWIAMIILSKVGFFAPKKLTVMQLMPLAMGFVGSVVLNNLSLNFNSVGFYQIMKIAITPAVIVLEFLMFSKVPSFLVLCAIVVVCAGVTISTVTDTIVVKNSIGIIVGLASTGVSGLYQIWAGTKQKELEANSSQLLLGYSPLAMCLLTALVPIFEPTGILEASPGPETLFGFNYTFEAILCILVSALLGALVTLSMFLVIGATSSLTYNIVGHVKTVIILTGGCVLFHEAMSLTRFLGISLAMTGIIWYSQISLSSASQAKAPVKASPTSTSKEEAEPLIPTPPQQRPV